MKNEHDIIESFVRHNAQFVDHVVVVDNGSFDGTREVLQHLVDEGLPLMVLDDDMLDYRQSAVMTYVSRRTLSALGCDRLFLLDADEFLNAGSKAELQSALAKIPADHHGRLPFFTYVMTPDDEPDDIVPKRLCHRRAEVDLQSKVVLSSEFLYQPEAIVAGGNHGVASSSPRVVSSPVPGLSLAHYPMRSLEQVQAKVAIGWAGYIASGYESVSGLGSHWRGLFDVLVDDPAAFSASIYEIAKSYSNDSDRAVALVQDRLPCSIEQRYGPGAPPNALSWPDRARSSRAATPECARPWSAPRWR